MGRVQIGKNMGRKAENSLQKRCRKSLCSLYLQETAKESKVEIITLIL